MNKSRKLSLINICVNLVIIVLELVGLYFLSQSNSFSVESLKYYTILTALVTFLGAALMIWANIVSYVKMRNCTPRLFYSIRFLSAVMSLLTFVTVAAFLVPSSGDMDLLFGVRSGNIFFHLLCPIISIVQFVGFETELKAKFKKTFEPLVATIIYAIAILVVMFVKLGGGEDPTVVAKWAPYFFFNVHPALDSEYVRNIGVAFAVVGISYVASLIVWTLNRICHNIFIGEVYQVKAPKAKVAKKKTATAPTSKKGNAFTSYVKKKVAFAGDDNDSTGGQVYHISFHDRRLKTWKVKSENAGRALKVFPTQKEAIAFANEQVKKNGGSIRVHSMVGQIRKE